jgi:transposase
MPRRSTPRRRHTRPRQAVQKPHGTFHPRVQKVGPEHFGIVCIDPAKARSKWMLTDFFGNILLPPTFVDHNRHAFAEALARLQQARQEHDLRDLIVAIERTGRYHHPPKRAFAQAGLETRIVHPFATKTYRQSSDPGNKTDDTDLMGIFRAAVNGFALVELGLDEQWTTLQLLIRHRRELVRKSAMLQTQIREHLDAAFPGFAACFSDLWERNCAWHLLRHFDSPAALLAAGPAGLTHSLDEAGIQFHRPTLDTILHWAAQAATPDLGAVTHRRFVLTLHDDRTQKAHQIQALERDIAAALADTPYILLLSIVGINVVSAADFAGEMGPMEHYANARAITGRSGLCPSRYQSDKVDHANGPLLRCCNRRLRAAVLRIADNLISCNNHFKVLDNTWKAAGKDPRDSRVKVASRFSRIAFQIVAGRQVFRHPADQGRDYVLDKLITFHREHDTEAPALLRDLQAALAQVPRAEYPAEAVPLAEELDKIHNGGRRGPQMLGDILPIVLARLGVGVVQSRTSGEQNST